MVADLPIYKRLSEWTEADLQGLVDVRAKEDDGLEYKRDMYGGNDEDVREMLRDITSMANHLGGHIIIGIDENDDGEADALVGTDADDGESRIRSSCLSNISRRLNGIEVRDVELPGDSVATVIRVPRSRNGPHMITFKGLNQFWRRYGRQKAKMSVDEIQEAMQRQFESETKAERFIAARKEYPLNNLSGDGRWVFVSATPALSTDEILDMTDPRPREIMYPRVAEILNQSVSCGEPLPSLHGLLAEDRDKSGVESYLTIHRNGHLEYATRGFRMDEDVSTIPSQLVAATVYDFLKLTAELFDHWGVVTPLIVTMTILNAKTLALAIPSGRTSERWQERNLDIPARFVVNVIDDWKLVAKDLNDRLWNAFRLERCLHFDANGNWTQG